MFKPLSVSKKMSGFSFFEHILMSRFETKPTFPFLLLNYFYILSFPIFFVKEENKDDLIFHISS